MQRMGLLAAEMEAYHRALASNHTVRVKVAVLTLSGQTVTSITPQILSGQVTVDMDAEVTRSLTLEFLDPNHALMFDSDDPNDGALYADRMLRVLYTIRVDELNRHVTAVPFTGPITKFERKGDVVSIEAQGKETFGLRAAWRPLTIKKFTPKVEAIRTIMEARAGENRFSFPQLAAKLPKPLAIGRMDQPWPRSRRIAKSMDRQLFYPGTGTCTLRRLPQTPVFTFRGGEGGTIVSDVSVSNQLEDFANLVEVIGAKPKGAKARVRYVARAPATHPLSPERLGRNGVPSFIVHRINDDHVRSRAEARRLAERVLRDRLRQGVEVACDVIPIPHLDEGDLVTFEVGDGSITTRLRKWVFPIHVEGAPTMPVGYHRDQIIRRRRLRRT